MTELIDRGVLAGTGYDRSTQYDSLNELAEALTVRQQTKRDYVVDTRRMTFVTHDQQSDLWFDSDDHDQVVNGGEILNHAHGQIAERLGIPMAYYRRMLKDAPAILDANVGGWFGLKPERRMVRMLDGKVRAFLSDRYRRLDDFDLMERAILPVLSETPGLHFQVAALTPTKLHINALLPGLTAEVKAGDIVQAGVAIRNSEVGSGAMHVVPRVWRLQCKNGLLVDAFALRKYHVGRQAEEEAYELFSDATLDADDTAYFMKCQDMIRAALTEATFQTIVSTLQETADTDPILNPVAATERLADRFDLRDDEKQSVLQHLATGGDLSQWGAINALTAAAKDAETYDRQRDMEAAGGALAHLTRAEWATVAVAA